MKRLLFLAFLTFGLISLFLVTGCEEDKTGVNNNGTIGDTTEAGFKIVDSIVGKQALSPAGASIDMSFAMFDTAFGQIFKSPRKNPFHSFALADSEEVNIQSGWTYDTSGGWHIFTFDAIIIDLVENDTVSISATDSVQFLIDSVPIITPDTTVNGFKIRNHFDWHKIDSSSYGSANHRVNLDSNNDVDPKTLTINGASDDSLYTQLRDTLVTCTLSIITSSSINDMVFVEDTTDIEDCPSSGSAKVTATIDLNCFGGGSSPFDSLNINGSWTVTATVLDNGDIRVTYTDGTTTWTVTETCNGAPVASSRRWTFDNHF